MPRVDSIEREIFKVEGFKVMFCHSDGRDVRDDRDGLPSYPYQKAACNDWRVAQWREQRFRPSYPDYAVRVFLGNDTEAHGLTRLATVRESYSEETPSLPTTSRESEPDESSFVRETSDRETREVWVVRAGYWGDEEPIALEHDIATIHWNELPDLSDVTSKEELEKLYRETYPDDNPHVVAKQVYQISAFRSEIKEGDLVILPLVRMWHALAVGEVTGPYAYRTDLGNEVLHTLPVEWLIADLHRSRLDPDLSKALGLPPTVYRIKTPPDAEKRFRAILRDEIDRRQRRILQNYPPIKAHVIHQDGAHAVRLLTLPRAGETLRLCPKGSTEPRWFQVESIVHDIGEEDNSHAIEVHVTGSTDHRPTSPT